MTDDINPIESDFNAALSRYQDGQELLPIVQDYLSSHNIWLTNSLIDLLYVHYLIVNSRQFKILTIY